MPWSRTTGVHMVGSDMASLLERDKILRECWINTRFRVPDPDPRGEHFPITALGVIADPDFMANGDKEFVDVVSYWPAARKWTVTYQVRGAEDAQDYECNVTYWQQMPPMPW